MNGTNGSVPVEAQDPEPRVLSAAIRFNGNPYIVFWNGSSWDCEPVPRQDVLRFELLERRWEAEKTGRIARISRKKEACAGKEGEAVAAKKGGDRE